MDALPVVASALRLGWSATVWEPSARIDTRARILGTEASLASGDLEELRVRIDAADDALAVVMGHDVRHDRSALAMLLRSSARYIGLLGPRHRTTALASQPSDLADPRVHAPIGLDLGAETPEEIALAISSELLAFVRNRSGGSLRDRAAIHEP
jgi:xanthine/CO dehydrogenase XdhC/CoxF family maturation factor